MLVDQFLEVIYRNVCLVHKNLVMNRSGSTLNRRVRAEIEVKLRRMSDISLNQGTRKWVAILISCRAVTLLREEPDVMTLCTNDNSELDLKLSLVDADFGRYEDLH